MTARSVRPVAFEGPAGRLEGLLHRPEGEARFVATVAHPHPLFGGTMDNKVAYRVARALDDRGGVVLRFNFRGVRGSEGAHDSGRGEQDDLRAAVARVRAEAAGLPLLLAGFSFGSVVSSRVACSADLEAAGLLLVGAPVITHRFPELSARPDGLPVACVQGEHDEHGPLAALREIWEPLAEPKRLVAVPGAGHFFDARQQELFDAVAALVDGGFMPRG